MPGAAASCTSAAKVSPQASVISGFSTQTQGSVAPASARLWFVPKPTGRALPRICSAKGQPPAGGKGGASGKFSVSTTRRTVALLSRAKSSSRRCTSGPWPWLTTETTKSPRKGEKQGLTPPPAQRGIPAVLPMGCLSHSYSHSHFGGFLLRYRPVPSRPAPSSRQPLHRLQRGAPVPIPSLRRHVATDEPGPLRVMAFQCRCATRSGVLPAPRRRGTCGPPCSRSFAALARLVADESARTGEAAHRAHLPAVGRGGYLNAWSRCMGLNDTDTSAHEHRANHRHDRRPAGARPG